jgi:hypothetical protein
MEKQNAELGITNYEMKVTMVIRDPYLLLSRVVVHSVIRHFDKGGRWPRNTGCVNWA